jgi:type IV secretion system protein VirB4
MAARLAGRELDAGHFLPFSHHVNERMIRLCDGELMVTIELEGLAFETANIADLNDWHEKLNTAWRNVADPRIALYVHTVRRVEDGYPTGRFRSSFAANLDAAYKARVTARRMFVNRHFLTLVLRPAAGQADKLVEGVRSLLRRGTPGQVEAEADAAARLDEALRDVLKLLGRLSPRVLATYERAGLVYSETLEFLAEVMTGERRAVPLVRGQLGSALYTDRIIFGGEVIEIREAGRSRYAGVLGVREHAARTRSGQLDALLSAQFEFVLGHGFAFYDKAIGLETARRRAGQLSAAEDVAVSQAEDLLDAMDDLQSNRFVLGEYHVALTVFGSSVKSLNESMSVARAALSESGMVAAREDLALEAAYWGQLPGNFKWRPRPAAITSRNFAALAPFHTYPQGNARGNHWGEAIALLKTTAHSPYFFNFHNGDLGHTLIIGPSGGGKTVIQNFLLAQSEKSGARQVFIDKDRGAEIYVRASGGTYLALRNGQPTGFAPLKALEHTPRNLEFLTAWVRQLVGAGGHDFSAQDHAAIGEGLRAVGRLPLGERSLGLLRSLLPQSSLEGIGPRLERWMKGGELGWMFDNDADTLALDARLMGFDMTDFLDNDEVRPPLMSYLFHRIDDVVDGRPVIIDIDEFWKALGDDAFRSFAQDGLKTYRKRNALMMFGTQSPADALRSDIAHSIIEQVATKILLPNPNATERDYVEGLNLTQAEYRLIKTELSPESRRFLVKRGSNSVVVELDLTGLDDELAVLSGRSSTVELLDAVRGEVGDDPHDWLPLFHQRRRRLGKGGMG